MAEGSSGRRGSSFEAAVLYSALLQYNVVFRRSVYAHIRGVSARTTMVQTARNCGLMRAMCRRGVRFPLRFPQNLWRSRRDVTVM
jgi:hypothetical protein